MPDMRLNPWLRLFRVVNLPTVPGDVLVGASVLLAGITRSGTCTTAVVSSLAPVWWAAAASIFLYVFGLVDNDIVGAKVDRDRPIPDGEISISAARVARFLCLLAAAGAAAAGGLPLLWRCAAGVLVAVVAVYNRTKWSALMGVCRGVNVLCGALAIVVGNWRGVPGDGRLFVLLPVVAWTIYIWIVTKYSEGEETDPVRRSRVGTLIGGILLLQIVAICACVAVNRNLWPLLAVGISLLVIHKVILRLLPRVSAS